MLSEVRNALDGLREDEITLKKVMTSTYKFHRDGPGRFTWKDLLEYLSTSPIRFKPLDRFTFTSPVYLDDYSDEIMSGATVSDVSHDIQGKQYIRLLYDVSNPYKKEGE